MVKIKQIMKKRVFTVDPEISMADAAKIMTNNKIGSLIIMDKSKPIGIITESDIVGLVARGISTKKVKIKDFPKKRRLVTASPDDNMIKVTRKMIKTGIKRVPIVKDGKLMGIVSDKEIMLVSPELMNIMSERLKNRVELVAKPNQIISGICEYCEAYSDDLKFIGGKWICESCRN